MVERDEDLRAAERRVWAHLRWIGLVSNREAAADALHNILRMATDARNERDAVEAVSFEGAEREKRLREALQKATAVLEKTTVLFNPKYLLHTDALIRECKSALSYRGEDHA